MTSEPTRQPAAPTRRGARAPLARMMRCLAFSFIGIVAHAGLGHASLDDQGANSTANSTDAMVVGEASNVAELLDHTTNTSKLVGQLRGSGADRAELAVSVGEGRIRLVGRGAAANQGRLEVYRYGEWGTVCDDHFHNNEAQVACRQYGYPNGLAVRSSNFGEGSGRIWLDEVQCTGTETMLRDCRHRAWGENDCSHREDVGVVCFH